MHSTASGSAPPETSNMLPTPSGLGSPGTYKGLSSSRKESLGKSVALRRAVLRTAACPPNNAAEYASGMFLPVFRSMLLVSGPLELELELDLSVLELKAQGKYM